MTNQVVFTSEDRAVVTVKAYQGADDEVQKQLVPERPGLYIWTHNIGRLLKADEPTVQSNLVDLLAVVGRPRSSSIRPYYQVTVQDQRHRIHDSKRLILNTRLNQADSLGTWIADMATQVQRPLYVGVALNLNKRINQHISGSSGLRDRLRAAKPKAVDMVDLAITWIAAPVEVPQAPEGELEEGPEEDGEGAQGGASTFAVGSELDQTLKAAESLLIRLAMPMFNEKQD